MNKKVLVIAAHPDDEWLGCGGTLLKHIKEKDTVFVVFVSDGYSSRDEEGTQLHRDKACKDLMKTIGAEDPIFFNFPDNQLDKIPRLKIIKEIEKIKKEIEPNIIYTHYSDDLNIDHRIVSDCAHTAFRPQPGEQVRAILQFEVLSSTEWTFLKPFSPNLFVDITDYLEEKIELLKFYKEEMKDPPHSRSIDNVRNLALFRGSTIGKGAAEAFIVSRLIL
jgi:LmbE family N-acetylglucosaminyl deacetylase